MSSFLILMSLNFQSCQEATAPGITKTTNESTTLQKSVQLQVTDLDLLAKNLASAFKNKILRKILSNDTKNSRGREHILDAKSFLEKDINIFSKPTTLKSYLLDNASLKTKSKLLKVFNKLKVGNLDIYFPVLDHLNSFNENIATLRVGYINPWKEWDPINVYNIDGKHEKLDAHTPPKEPVLMVNYCEHHGKHKIPLKSIVNTQTIEGGDDGGGGSGSGGSGSGGSGSSGNGIRDDGEQEYLDKAKQRNGQCQEPWGSGDPEIMYEIKNAYGTIVHTQAFQKSNGDSYFDCEYTWYGELFHDYDWKTPSSFPSVYTWEQGVNSYIWHWWEDDGNVDWDTEYQSDVDDDMGSTTVYRSNSSSTMYETTGIDFYVRWNDN